MIMELLTIQFIKLQLGINVLAECITVHVYGTEVYGSSTKFWNAFRLYPKPVENYVIIIYETDDKHKHLDI